MWGSENKLGSKNKMWLTVPHCFGFLFGFFNLKNSLGAKDRLNSEQ